MSSIAIEPSKPAMNWRDRLLAVRDQLLMSPRFQRFAARSPLTRGIAGRRAADLFDLTAGFVYSQVLSACVELDLFRQVAEEPRAAAALAERAGLGGEAMDRLLLAAEALGLLQRRSNGNWGLGSQGAAFLGNPGIAAMVQHHHLFYDDLRDPLQLLRDRGDTALNRYWAYAANTDAAELQEDAVTDYSRLMAESQGLVADDILDAVGLRDCRRLIDVGGGEGIFAIRAAGRWPHLSVDVLDLPAVARRADARIREAGCEDRVHGLGGDLFRLDTVAGDYDRASLVRVLHDHDDVEVVRILRGVRGLLRPGGELIVAEPMADTPGGGRIGHAYFGFYLWAMGSGRARSLAEMREMLAEAGFGQVRERRTARPLLVRVLVARD
jgi:demethylspheroidene O-methyltransferase